MNLHRRADADEQDVTPLEEKPRTKKQSQESVIIYLVVLFTAVFLLILLSYFMHQRQNEAELSSLSDQHTEYRLRTEQSIAALQTENERLKAELEAANAKIEELEKEKEVQTND
jgi:cytoskeletal protein RodZ